MLTHPDILRHQLHAVIRDKQRQGRVTDGLAAALDATPASWDALHAFAQRLAALPVRAAWPHHEPSAWADIRAAWDAEDLAPAPVDDAPGRIAAGFAASCAGCILGKPLEVDPTLDEIRAAAMAVGEWPLRDYVSEALLERLGRRHGDWPRCVRGRIDHVALDDDRAGIDVALQFRFLRDVQPAGRGHVALEPALEAHALLERDVALENGVGAQDGGEIGTS